MAVEGLQTEQWWGQDEKAVVTAATATGGAFVFAAVAPGSYTISTSHSELTIDNHTAEFEMGWGNHQLAHQFVVTGYDVRGQVRASGESIVGVALLLYSDPPDPSGHAVACSQDVEVMDRQRCAAS